MQKNVSGQKWIVFAFDVTDNTAKTGDAAQITAEISKDGAAGAALGDTNPTELEDGYYVFDLTQAETNADMLALLPESSTSDIQVIGVPGVVYTTPPNFAELGIESDGDLTQVNDVANQVSADVTAISGDSSAADNIEADYDGTGYNKSASAIGSVGSVTAAVTTDSASREASKATGFSTHSAADVWAVATRTLSSFGSLVSTIWANATRTLTAGTKDSEIDAILTDTGTTLPATLAEIQADISDLPTNAELEARTLPAADYFDPDNDTVAQVTLVDTVTTNTDMRGTDGAVTALTGVATEAKQDTIISDIAGVETKVDAVQVDVTEILDYEAGNWAVINNQMIFYKKDGSELQRFNLTKDGVASMDEPDARTRA